MNRKAKVGAGVGILAVVIAGAAVSISASRRGAVAVRIEPVKRENLTATVTASGWVRPHRKVDVQSDIMGRVTALQVREGAPVHKGDVLLRIDPTQYEAAVARARAAVSQALAQEAQTQANVLQAQRALQRNQEMATRDSMLVSRQQLEDAQTALKVQQELEAAAKYGVAQARASLAAAENDLAKTVIRSPMNGVITRRNVDVGEMAIVGTMNNPRSLLLTVSDLSDMEAVIRVDETDVPEIHLGDSASVSIDAFPHRTFTGRVSEIAHSAVQSQDDATNVSASQQQAVDFEVVIKLDNPPATLRPDLSATADVVTATRKDALTIPIIALTVRERDSLKALPQESPQASAAAEQAQAESSKDQEGVFVVKAGKAHFVPVKVGIAGKEQFEVLSGVAEGDSVVAGPYETIRTLEDGKPVKHMAPPARKGPGAPTESVQ